METKFSIFPSMVLGLCAASAMGQGPVPRIESSGILGINGGQPTKPNSDDGGAHRVSVGPNCHSPDDIDGALASDHTFNFIAADDFVPNGSQIGSVTWWGTYIDVSLGFPDCGPGPGDEFYITIYSDDGGLPGSLVWTNFVTPTKSLTGSYQKWGEYEFVAELIPPVPVSPGECYWIEIVNFLFVSGCQYFWSPSTSGNLHCVQDVEDGDYEPWDSIYESDLAFCIDGAIEVNDCGDVIGVCCGPTPGTCSMTTQSACGSDRWMMEGSCNPNPCGVPPNNDCAAAVPIFDGQTPYDTWFATTSGFGTTLCDSTNIPIRDDIWFTYSATCTGNLSISLCDGTQWQRVDPILAVYGDETATCGCPSASPLISCADNTCESNPFFTDRRPFVIIPAVEGNCYMIRVGSAFVSHPSPDQGFGEVKISCRCPFPNAPTIASSWQFPYQRRNRFLSFVPGNAGMEAAIRVKLESLHHVIPPYSGGPSVPFSSFEGQVRWVGPPMQYVESTSSMQSFFASSLQCTPHYQDWGTVGLLHVTGSAVVPSSNYVVQMVNAECDAGAEVNYSETLILPTSRWGDVESAFNPPATTAQPDVGDIAALVGKFRSAVGAPIKARALLAGTGAGGDVNMTPDFDFSHIAACVDAFRGKPYPYAGPEACP